MDVVARDVRFTCSSFWRAVWNLEQSTVREPSVRGMRRALLLQYTAGAAGYYGISVAGYWAYGSSVSEYLPNQLGGPRWAAVLINAAAFLQSVVSQHVRRLRLFFSPSVRERSYMQMTANPSCTNRH
jgi:hypothetical protein